MQVTDLISVVLHGVSVHLERPVRVRRPRPARVAVLAGLGVAVLEHLPQTHVDGVLGRLRLAALLEQEQDDRVLDERAEHEEDAHHQVEVDRVQAGRNGRSLAERRGGERLSLNGTY